MGRSTAKLGRHVTLGTPGEVGRCDSRNNDRDPSCGKEHAVAPSSGAAVFVSDTLSDISSFLGGAEWAAVFVGRKFVLGVDKLKLIENRRKGCLYTSDK